METCWALHLSGNCDCFLMRAGWAVHDSIVYDTQNLLVGTRLVWVRKTFNVESMSNSDLLLHGLTMGFK